MKFYPEKLNDLLWERRKRQATLARELGCHPAVVSTWIKGRAIPSAIMLIKLSKALDVHPAYFFDHSYNYSNYSEGVNHDTA